MLTKGWPRFGISVIIPAYNASATLDQALNSLRTQSFDGWEAIVVDDGSDDKTAQIAADWSRQDRRIRLHRLEKNSGVSVARNSGLKMATKDFVLFLDADDWIGRHHLAQLVAVCQKGPQAEVAYSHATMVSSDGKLGPVLEAPPADMIYDHAACGCPFVIHACLVSRGVILGVGGFDASLTIGEDWDLWVRLARRGTRFVRISQASAYYRHHVLSAMHSATYPFESIVALIGKVHKLLSLDCVMKTRAIFFQVAWHTGHRLGSARDVDWALSHVPDVKIEGVNSKDFIKCLFNGILQGAGVMPGDLANKWPQYRSALFEPIDKLSFCLVIRPTVEEMLLGLDRHLIDAAGPDATPLSVGHMHAMRWHLEDGWPKEVKVQPGIKALRIWMTAGGAPIGIVDVPVGASSAASPPPSLAAFADALPGRSLIRIFWALHGTGRRRELLQLFGRGKTRQLARELLKVPHDQRRARIVSFLAENVDFALKRFA